MNQRKVSLFANCKQKVQQEITLEEVRARAGEAKHMQVIKQIEAAASRGDKDEADRLKRTLPAVVFGGLFRGGHAVKNLVAGSGLLVLDFDKLTPEQVETALRILREQPSVVMAAPSPTGRGIKVVVCTDHDPSRHPEVFAYTSQYFESLLNLTVDQSGKDISRLCFLFSIEKLHYNEHAQPLDLSQIGTCAAVALPVVKPPKTDPSEVVTGESGPTTEGGRIKGIPTHVMRKLRMSTGNAS
ncbi:MAG: BT4734/BF3469 family protein, partial [Tannerellaceae bacterium]